MDSERKKKGLSVRFQLFCLVFFFLGTWTDVLSRLFVRVKVFGAKNWRFLTLGKQQKAPNGMDFPHIKKPICKVFFEVLLKLVRIFWSIEGNLFPLKI